MSDKKLILNTMGYCITNRKNILLSYSYIRNLNTIEYSVFAGNEKDAVGEGAMTITSDYVLLNYIVSHEVETYKHIGTALIEAALEIMKIEELPSHMKLVSLAMSRGFFAKLGFSKDFNMVDNFREGSTSMNMTISGRELAFLHEKLLTANKASSLTTVYNFFLPYFSNKKDPNMGKTHTPVQSNNN